MPDIPAVHCEAKKIAYRQTKEGLVVSFVIHPNDFPDSLAVAPLGQRYMLALCAIGDDEQPVEMTARGAPQEPPAGTAGRDAVQGADGGSGRHPSSATRLNDSAASQRAKERYATSSEMQQALIRAGRLPSDHRYQEWAAGKCHWDFHGDEQHQIRQATEFLRAECNIGSRTRIAEERDAYERFIRHETEFKLAVGEMASPR